MMRRIVSAFALAGALTACSDTTGPSGQLGVKGPPTIVVQNRTANVIEYVFISPCNVSTWGSDWLGSSEVIGQNADRAFTVTAGCWDIRVETADSRYVERAAIQLVAGDRFAFTVTTF